MAGPSFCVQPRTGLHIGDMGKRVRRSRGFSRRVPPSLRLDLAAFFQRFQNSMSLVSIPANPVPEDAVSGTIKTPDGAEIRFARWAPPANRKGTVCIFQGRSEYIEKYFETVRDLRERGFAVATLDWRGQGMSERALGNPRKGHVRNFAQYQIDLESFINEIVLPDCPPPLFALGQSMGATILLRAAHAGHRWFDRTVLLAPMIALPGPRRSSFNRIIV